MEEQCWPIGQELSLKCQKLIGEMSNNVFLGSYVSGLDRCGEVDSGERPAWPGQELQRHRIPKWLLSSCGAQPQGQFFVVQNKFKENLFMNLIDQTFHGLIFNQIKLDKARSRIFKEGENSSFLRVSNVSLLLKFQFSLT